MFPELELVTLELGKVLYESGSTMRHVYFPVDSIISLLYVMTDAAGKLQRLGVIEYSRGHITVLDRQQLETLSCECYAVVKQETDRLLPYLHRTTGASN